MFFHIFVNTHTALAKYNCENKSYTKWKKLIKKKKKKAANRRTDKAIDKPLVHKIMKRDVKFIWINRI